MSATMSYEDKLQLPKTAEFEIEENELWIFHPFDFGDVHKDITGLFLNRGEAVQLRNFLSKWLDGVDPVAVARARNYGDWNGHILDDDGNPKLREAAANPLAVPPDVQPVCLHEAGVECVCRKCGQTVNYGIISPSSLGVELGLASIAMFEEQKEVYRALRRMERTKVCAKCGQDPYDGHDMCTGNEANAPKQTRD